MSFARLASRYLSHLIHSVDEYGVHSPFLFKLLTESVYSQHDKYGLPAIERLRKKCLANDTEIDVLDLGAGSRLDGKNNKRSVRFICKSFAKNIRLCKLLHNTVKHLQPEITIELGTSLGFSTMYLASGHKSGKVYTVEGCPNTRSIALKNFDEAELDNIESMTGNFDEVLPDLLEQLGRFDCAYIDGNHTYEATIRYFESLQPYAQNGSLIIFDDIHWSGGMTKAWEQIISSQKVTMSVDFFHLGMVFFNPGFSKEHFRIRL